jgi:hypothetical protein
VSTDRDQPHRDDRLTDEALAALVAEMDDATSAAAAEADAHFPAERLERQRNAILRRLEYGRRMGRLLRFPAPTRRPVPAGPSHRRWIAAAAAAGLLLGLFTGRYVGVDRPRFDVRADRSSATIAPAVTAAAPGVGAPLATDEALLGEVDIALASHRSVELQALDALTPRAK